MTEFRYFDGREWDDVFDFDILAPGVTVERDVEELSTWNSRRIVRVETNVHVDPPTRALYPRPVETVEEARALYLADDIGEDDLERYLEPLLAADAEEVDVPCL